MKGVFWGWHYTEVAVVFVSSSFCEREGRLQRHRHAGWSGAESQRCVGSSVRYQA